MSEANLVIVDNGDAEPELWAFSNPQDAERFAGARGNGATVHQLPVLDETEAKAAIEHEETI